jgi:hypothetical protein
MRGIGSSPVTRPQRTTHRLAKSKRATSLSILSANHKRCMQTLLQHIMDSLGWGLTPGTLPLPIAIDSEATFREGRTSEEIKREQREQARQKGSVLSRRPVPVSHSDRRAGVLSAVTHAGAVTAYGSFFW